jgi:hypothetical protein
MFFPVPPRNDDQGPEVDDFPNATPEELDLRVFVGPNADYYLRSWEPALRMHRVARGFNFWAFLFGVNWLLFRRMYRIAFAVYAILVADAFVEALFCVGMAGWDELPRGPALVVGLIVALMCGAGANRWYLLHAQKVIAQVDALGLPTDERLKLLQCRGGTRLGVAVTLGALLGLVGVVLTTCLGVVLAPR